VALEVTETATLIIYETDEMDPPFYANFPRSGYGKDEHGNPTVLPRDTRLITTRGYLNFLAGDRHEE
jgi:hypothetical protein